MNPTNSYIDRILYQARVNPDQEALYDVATGKHFTWMALKKTIVLCLSDYAEKGVKNGDTVVLLLASQCQTLLSFYALTSLGAVTVFVNPDSHPQELEQLLQQASATHVIASYSYYQKFAAILHTNPTIQAVLIPENVSAPLMQEEPIIFAGEPQPERLLPLVNPSWDTVVSLNFTYKGTGKPLAIPHTYGNYNRALLAVQEGYTSLPCGDGQTTIALLPFYAVFGLFMTGLYPLFRGGRLLLAAGELYKLPELIQHFQATMLCVVPPLLKVLKRILSKKSQDSLPPSGLLVLSGGSKLDLAVQQAFTNETGLMVAEGYGTTEILPYTTNFNTGVSGSVGRFSMPNTDVHIRDAFGKEVAPGLTGKIWVQVPWLPLQSWHGDTSFSQFVENGWFNTGDLGHMDAHRNLFITNRHFAFTKIKGIMVDLIEVENVLTSHPSIASAKVLSITNQEQEHELVAHVASEGISVHEIKTFLNSRVASFKVPKTIVVMHSNEKSYV